MKFRAIACSALRADASDLFDVLLDCADAEQASCIFCYRFVVVTRVGSSLRYEVSQSHCFIAATSMPIDASLAIRVRVWLSRAWAFLR